MRYLSAAGFDCEASEFRGVPACDIPFRPASEPGGTIGKKSLPVLHEEESPVNIAAQLELSLSRQPGILSEDRVGEEEKEPGESELNQRPSQHVQENDEEFHTRRPRQVTCLCSMRPNRELANKPKKNKSGRG